MTTAPKLANGMPYEGFLAMNEIDQPQGIDHPAHVGWGRQGLNIMDASRERALRERFEGSDESVDAVIAAVELASVRTDAYRRTYESANLGKLALSNSEAVRYTQMAGNAVRAGDFIRWFSLAVTGAFEWIPAGTKDNDKIALEIGGNRQAGYWESTHELDEMARSIPGQLQDIDDRIGIKLSNKLRNYVFLPQYSQGGAGRHSFDFGLIRRRRDVADIQVPSCKPVNIFKESIGLIAMNQLDEYDRERIFEAYRSRDHRENEKKNSNPANIAGRAFERAITEPRGRSRDIIPISAHYVMVAHRAGRFALL